MQVLGTGLGALEGPVTCRDGSLIVTSIDQGKLYRIADGRAQVFAITGGGPNGATEGEHGLIYVAQNGGAAPAKNEIPSAAGVQVVEHSGELRRFGDEMRSARARRWPHLALQRRNPRMYPDHHMRLVSEWHRILD